MSMGGETKKQTPSIPAPFLTLPGSVRSECLPTFTQAVADTIRVSQCRVSNQDAQVENTSTTIQLGDLKVLATNGTAIDLEIEACNRAYFIIPFETQATLDVAGNPFSISNAQDIVYIPPTPWKIAVGSPQMSILIIVVDIHAIHARMESMLPATKSLQSVKDDLDHPVLLSSVAAYGDALSHSIQANLRFIESVISQPGHAITRLGLGDLLLRQLLFPWNEKFPAIEEDTVVTLEFNQLIDWIRQHCCEPICLADLEALSGYTGRSLQRAFQKRFGCGPMRWIRRERLAMACQMLDSASPGTRIEDIAKECGYSGLAAFSREFKNEYHIKPSQRLGRLWRYNKETMS
jgi:AraC-like DNA-binding protein